MANRRPGLPDRADGVDNDCDGAVDEDRDPRSPALLATGYANRAYTYYMDTGDHLAALGPDETGPVVVPALGHVWVGWRAAYWTDCHEPLVWTVAERLDGSRVVGLQAGPPPADQRRPPPCNDGDHIADVWAPLVLPPGSHELVIRRTDSDPGRTITVEVEPEVCGG